jgi:iron complex outermembrane receptor protein
MSRAILLTCVLFSFPAFASPPEPAAGESARPFKIAAEEATRTLNEYSIQADKKVLFDFQALRDRKTHAVDRMLTPSAALQSMLEGTGLVADEIDSTTIAIRPKKPQPSK